MSNNSITQGVSLQKRFRAYNSQEERRDLIRRYRGEIREIKLNSRTEDIASSYPRGTGNQKTHLNNKRSTQSNSEQITRTKN